MTLHAAALQSHGLMNNNVRAHQTCFQRIHAAELKKLATTDPGVTSASAAASNSVGSAS